MTKKNSDMTPDTSELKRKRDRVAGDVRRMRERGELTEDQIAQLDAIGFSWIPKGRAVAGETDFATTHPDLAAEWHPYKNGDLTPQDVTYGTRRKIWWRCANGHEWQAVLANRVNGNGCPYCAGQWVLPGVNDLATTHPDLAAQWHPTKNGGLIPRDVSAGSSKRVWWRCDKEHEWKVSVNKRVIGRGCPYCSNKKVLAGYNDLATKYPALADEWHPFKNGEVTPQMVGAGSAKRVWWQCKHGHEWEAKVVDRTGRGSGCPYCAGRKALPGFNDLATKYPALADEWHPTKNGDLTPQQVVAGSNRKVWWCCERGHEWEARISHREKGVGCPFCSGQRAIPGENDLATVNPELAAEWHPTRNGGLTPRDVMAGSGKRVWWRCEKGHEWEAIIRERSGRSGRKPTGCPICYRAARKKKGDQR